MLNLSGLQCRVVAGPDAVQAEVDVLKHLQSMRAGRKLNLESVESESGGDIDLQGLGVSTLRESGGDRWRWISEIV